MSGIIAKKVGMSRVFLEDGEAVAVTYLQVQPNTIVRTKTEEKDGYNAVVLGVEPKKWKTRKGKEHIRYSVQKEWRVESLDGLEAGKEFDTGHVQEQCIVSICALSKGKGFQGVVKRHNFRGGPKTHGSHHHRRPGSVGMCEFPGRVLKGQRMPGQMGGNNVTIKGRPVVVCDQEKGIVGVKGPVPGPNGSFVYLTVESSPNENA